MLIFVLISNFQLIENTQVDLTDNLIALTGESGSGKSSFLNAVSAGLGLLRVDDTLIQKNKKKATVELHFAMDSLDQDLKKKIAAIRYGLDLDINEKRLILTRTLERGRPSRAQIDAKSVPLKQLTAIGQLLCEILDQNAGHTLNAPSSARFFLDNFAGPDHKKLLVSLTSSYKEYEDLLCEKERLNSLLPRAKSRIAILEEEVTLIEGAMSDLKDEASIFEAFSLSAEIGKKREHLFKIRTAVDGMQSSLDMLSKNKSDHLHPSLTQPIEALVASWQECSWEVERESQHLTDAIDTDKLEEKLQKIEKTKRRFGANVEEISTYLSCAQEELWELLCIDDKIDAVQKSIKKAFTQVVNEGNQLSNSRQKAAIELSKILTKHLNELNFLGAKASIEITETSLTREGKETLRFLLTPGKGAKAVDLHKSASGGEKARFFLALKLAGCQDSPPPLLILDEVDASLGGVSSKKMQEKLQTLSKQRQIICITHFPQVAKHIAQHLCVRKNENQGHISSTFTNLTTEQERNRELQRMLGEDSTV